MKTQTLDPTWLERIEIVGGHPATDFVNTVHSYANPEPRDYLENARHVIEWHLHRHLIDATQARRMATRLTVAQGDELLADARNLRATLHTLLDDRLQKHPDADALSHLNGELERLARWRKLERDAEGFAWHYQVTPTHPHSLFAPLVFAAAALLQSPELARLKVCPPPEGCGWLFIDRSRNGSRTWCNMKTCGNLAKQRRHRARQSGKRLGKPDREWIKPTHEN